MCGIAGIIAPAGIDLKHLTAMSEALQHRGPDGSGLMLYSREMGIRVYSNQAPRPDRYDGFSVGFAHRRLSIIDLSVENMQPMVSGTLEYAVSYNGELYNYQELRRELEKLGYTFRTRGDTEVLLRAYEAWGPASFSRMNGMWAFALLDLRRNEVVFCRDRFGIKPLYYQLRDNHLYFASEIKGMLAVPGVRFRPNERTVSRFICRDRVDDSQETFFDDIFQFPAAHATHVSLVKTKVTLAHQRYWSFPTTTFRGTREEAVSACRELFLDAVRIHTRSDVPVGTCLSGGLDSSSIVCSANELRKRQVIPDYSHVAFGYCASEREFDEKPYMDSVVKATSIGMHYVHISLEQFQRQLPKILWAQDEPFGSASVVAQWFVFESAKKEGLKVMLDGQGADEILAGYHKYFSTIAARKLAGGDILGYCALRRAFEREIGHFPLSHLGGVRLLVSRFWPELVGIASHLRRFGTPLSLRTSLTDALGQYLQGDDEDGHPGVSSLNETLASDVESRVLPPLLRYEDRNSMAHSIEARVPFLDSRLVEFLFTLPEEWKISHITTKYILREAMRGILPDIIRTRRDKIGFKAPSSLTFRYIAHHREVLVKNQNEFERRWFKSAVLERLLTSGDQSIAAEFSLWRILNTKLWLRQFWGEDRVGESQAMVDADPGTRSDGPLL